MRHYSSATEEETVFDVAARMRSEGTFVALVSEAHHSSLKAADVLGVLGREDLGDVIDEYVDFYSGRQR